MSTESQLRIASIDAECEVLMRRIETLGEEGLVDEATACNDTLKRLKGEKEFLVRVFFFFFFFSGSSSEKLGLIVLDFGINIIITEKNSRETRGKRPQFFFRLFFIVSFPALF